MPCDNGTVCIGIYARAAEMVVCYIRHLSVSAGINRCRVFGDLLACGIVNENSSLTARGNIFFNSSTVAVVPILTKYARTAVDLSLFVFSIVRKGLAGGVRGVLPALSKE